MAEQALGAGSRAGARAGRGFRVHRKARLFGDEQIAARVLAAPHPSAAKALGRQVRGFDETV